MTKGRKTMLDERIEIVSYCIANGKDYAAAIERYKVSYPQIYSWVRRYELEGPDDILAAGTRFFHIRGQREHLKLIVPCHARAGNPAIIHRAAVRHVYIERLIWLIRPSVPEPEQFAFDLAVRLNTGVTGSD